MKSRIKKLLPGSFRGQMVAIVLMALILSVAISVVFLGGAYNKALSNMNKWALLRRVVTLVELIEQSPNEFHRSIIKATNVRYEEVRLGKSNAVQRPARTEAEKQVKDFLLKALGDEYSERILVRVKSDKEQQLPHAEEQSSREESSHGKRKEALDKRFFSERGTHRNRQGHRKLRPEFLRDQSLQLLQLSIQLNSGKWLNMRAIAPPLPKMMLTQTVIFLLLSVVTVLVAVIFMVRRITEPMKQLTGAAHQLGVGEHVEPIAEKGPQDIRDTINAFNVMNERMQRFVSDRTRMLASLSHDLRTPITTMRLRIEMMPESEDRNQLLSTLEDMQQMSEATLAFMRQASDNEKSRKVDLNALLDSLCEDFVEIGYNVQFQEGSDIVINCRLVSLKRALRNLIENGIKYGEKVRVYAESKADSVLIVIQDSGPGVPEEKMEKIFEPFVRLEESRNRDTGGIGLGLSIARNIIHGHGGEISLTNNKDGLQVSVKLPL